jgi:hypothetical protein
MVCVSWMIEYRKFVGGEVRLNSDSNERVCNVNLNFEAKRIQQQINFRFDSITEDLKTTISRKSSRNVTPRSPLNRLTSHFY